jgi:putative endonuclease
VAAAREVAFERDGAFPKRNAPYQFETAANVIFAAQPQYRRLSAEKAGAQVCVFSLFSPQWTAMGWMEQIRITGLERSIAALNRLAQMRKVNAMPVHLAVGIEGENAALFFFRRKGYTVVARRWSAGNLPGDIDLVAWQGPMLCFIEVKTRTAHDMTPAEVAVDSHKRHVLRRLARQYVRQLPQKSAPPVRFDVLSVYLVPGQKKEFQHFEASFGWSEERGEAWG